LLRSLQPDEEVDGIGASDVVFYLVKIEPRCSRQCAVTCSLCAPSLAGEEGVLAHCTVSGARGITTGSASIAASFSIGVRPRSAIEKRSWL
jgi:hypothetical protein